jgi:hypothetical protein
LSEFESLSEGEKSDQDSIKQNSEIPQDPDAAVMSNDPHRP